MFAILTKIKFDFQEMELRQLTQTNKRTTDELNTIKSQFNIVKTQLEHTSIGFSEKEGVVLSLEKEIKKLKANLKLSQNENDQCQKRLERSTDDINSLRNFKNDNNQKTQKLEQKVSDLENFG